MLGKIGEKNSTESMKSVGLVITFSFSSFSTIILVFLAVFVRAKAINKLIEIRPRTKKETQEILEESGKLYLILIDSIKLMSTYFCLILIFKIVEIGFHLSFQSFSTFSLVFYGVSDHFLTFHITGIIYLSYVLFSSVFLIIASCGIKRECSIFFLLLAKYQVKSHINFRTFMTSKLETLDASTSVSCGLFAIDWKIVMTILSAVLSYSIILVQFQMSIDSMHKES